MNQWEQTKDIFDQAAIRHGAERSSYLDKACAGNRDLRVAVEALLQAHDEAERFLEHPTLDPAVRPVGAAPEPPGTVIDRYRLVEHIGEGGFGDVYLAEQVRPMQRRVALKVIKLGMDTREVIARFEAERQALALMDHPAIARVLDAGATERGRPYFVMEYVHGAPITAYCRENGLDLRRRLSLLRDVCLAVQHAHLKGIIHRDIKPSNVLVTLVDGRPVPKVIDFGIAKATNHRLTEKTVFTEEGRLIGTPEYMSPEQAVMNGVDVDARTDIYSLGILLYELITGVTPFEARDLRRAAYGEIQRIIREEEPQRPSVRLRHAAEPEAVPHRGTPVDVNWRVDGDLDWIVMKALENDRNRRYESAAEFGQDIERYLADQPVSAGPPGHVYRLRRFARRRQSWTVAALLSLVSLSVLVVIFLALLISAQRARVMAREAQHAAMMQRAEAEFRAQQAANAAAEMQAREDALRSFTTDLLQGADPAIAAGRELVTADALAAASDRLNDGSFEGQPVAEGQVRATLGRTYAALGEYVMAREQFEVAMTLLRDALGSSHPDVLTVEVDFIDLLVATGAHEEAQALIDDTAGRVSTQLGREHPLNARLGLEIAELLLEEGRIEEASAVYRALGEGLGMSETNRTRLRLGQAVMLLEEERLEEGLVRLDQAVSFLEEQAMLDNPRIRRMIGRIVEAFDRLERPDEAAAWRSLLTR